VPEASGAAVAQAAAVRRSPLANPQAAVDEHREWLLVLAMVVVVKAAMLVADPDPRFFMGDSAAYVKSAVEGWVPRDRSFAYGGLIWLTAVLPHTLHGLVLAQTAAGIASTLLVFLIVRQLLGIAFPFAAAAAVLVALEPAQLFYERMVMTETFAGTNWLAFVACVLAYARDGRHAWLVGAVLLGLAGAMLRQNAILAAIVVPAVVPLLRRAFVRSPPLPWRTTMLHVAVVVLSTAALHGAYRHAVGRLTQSPPGYIGQAGVAELGFVAPLVKPSHFAGTGCAPGVLDRVQWPLADPNLREAQIWSPGGLWDVMQRACPDPEAAARVVADRALRSRPFALLPMSLAVLAKHFDAAAARWRMNSDLGRYPLYPDFVVVLRRHFGLDAVGFPFRDTATSRWFDASRWWLTWTYLGMPLFVAALAWCARRRRDAAVAAFALLAGVLFASQALFTHTLCYRYLYAFPVLALIAVATVFGRRAATDSPDRATA
jgi:hypothetical protein